MTIHQNNLIIPPRSRYNAKVVILVDTLTGTTELKIEQGRMGHIQVLGLLMEHATALLRNMISTRQNPILDGVGNNTPKETDNGAT
jgi:hypothetical protein